MKKLIGAIIVYLMMGVGYVWACITAYPEIPKELDENTESNFHESGYWLEDAEMKMWQRVVRVLTYVIAVFVWPYMAIYAIVGTVKKMKATK